MKVRTSSRTNVPSLAQRCRVHVGSMYRALNDVNEAGVHNCSPELAIAIHRATEGAIPCWDLRPDLWAVGQLPPGLTHPPLPEAS